MKPYYLKDLFGVQREFVDRNKIRTLVLDEARRSNQESYFKVLEIYGFGGMGKTRLLAELEDEISDSYPEHKIIRVSFEIYKNHQILNNLSIIRKKLKFPCLFFDYALAVLWDRSGTQELCDDLLPQIYDGFLVLLADTVSPYISQKLPIPSIENLFKIASLAITKVKVKKHKNMLESINSLSDNQLIERMPVYLGLDINNHYIENNSSIIFMFDAYIQSKPYSSSNEWLLHMISHIQRGLFIITGREKLLWEDAEHNILPYELSKYPVKETREYLQKYIKGAEIIDAIIDCTDCIPIYVDLAIDVYLREYDINEKNIVDKSIFTDRTLLVNHFINHLKPEWQDCIIYLSVIRVFNEGIFKQIVFDLNLPTSLVDYKEITCISLAQYSEKTTNLFKLHDVFCSNASRILPDNTKFEILKSYLSYLEYRGIYFDSNITENDVVVLFNNLLRLEIEISNATIIPDNVIEHTLTIFFILQDMRIRFSVPEPNPSYKQNINDLLYFINGVLVKQDSTKKSTALLENVVSTQNFGRHYLSYEINYKYNKSLAGQYLNLKSALNDYNSQLKEEDINMWYYNRIKFYMADYQIMDGDFRIALNNLNRMKEHIPEDIYNRDNILHLYRYIGHIYRFNMFVENAVSNYNELLTRNNIPRNAKVYLNTNICESVCYTNPDYLFNIFDDTLRTASDLGQAKNIGKLYYSRAIANVLTQKYSEAQEDIRHSIEINTSDGYDSGCLFAYMAQAYLDYANKGYITADTIANIDKLLENGVYQYFQLPICIMQKQEDRIKQMATEFSWLDFEYTVNQYRIFIAQINQQHG